MKHRFHYHLFIYKATKINESKYSFIRKNNIVIIANITGFMKNSTI